jgi:hypothetical protein
MLFCLQMIFSINFANNLIEKSQTSATRQLLMQQECSWMGKTISDHQRTWGVKNGWGSTTISCGGSATGE